MSVSYDIRSFGAIGDGVHDDTEAFETAIRTINEHGGGRLIVNGNGARFASHYLIRPINLTSDFVLYIEKGATISAVADEKAWPLVPPLPSYGNDQRPGPQHMSMLQGEHLWNVTIQGEGNESVIDGQGEYWWEKRRSRELQYGPGRLIAFLWSSDIRIYNLRMINSPSWNNHFFDCDSVHVKNVHIYEPESGPYTDGWDPDSCRNVLIEDSTYHGGDDCVAIKAGWDCFGIDYGKPSVNITVRNLTCHGFSAGIAIGSEMSGGIENVTIENVRFTKANKPANIKVGRTRGGYVRNITWRDIQVDGPIQRAIHVDMFHYNDSPNPSCPDGWKPPALTEISNISFIRINGTQATFVDNQTFHFTAYDESPIKNVYMEDVYFGLPEYGVGWNCSAVQGVVVNQTVTPWPPCPELTVVNRPSSTDNVHVDHYFMASYVVTCAFFLVCAHFLKLCK